MDVEKAFLRSLLTTEVYMVQPQGFEDATRPQHVCKLNWAIYGLKEAPRAWSQCFSSALVQYGFVPNHEDPHMFVFHSSKEIVILLLYVDNIILTSSSSTLPQGVLAWLSSNFAMKDLGDLHYLPVNT